MTLSHTGDRLRTAVHSPQAPAAIGPYSQAIRHDHTLFCSGALPVDPATGELVSDHPADQTTQCLHNLAEVCRAADTTLRRALRLTVYTTRLDRFAEINDAYAAFFADDPPARVTIGVAQLPKNATVEIDAIVALT
ncbi:MAG TPA: Rid family detoxifying hydrolase [Capillimicrobium sp.]|nr:Rid family detoxifying hydrolase [Capillimicrobium sp.]